MMFANLRLMVMEITPGITLQPAHGAVAAGAPRFPTADEPEARRRRGGGLVVIHDGMCGTEPDWFSRLTGGAKMHGGPKNSRSGMMRLHFEDPANPSLKGAVDFDFDDEMNFDKPQGLLLREIAWDVSRPTESLPPVTAR